MPYSHSFGPEFYGDAYNAIRWRDQRHRPSNLADAIASMRKRDYERLCRRLFGGLAASVEDIMAMAIESNTVSNLNPPIEVWIDPDGIFTVLVWNDDPPEEF